MDLLIETASMSQSIATAKAGPASIFIFPDVRFGMEKSGNLEGIAGTKVIPLEKDLR